MPDRHQQPTARNVLLLGAVSFINDTSSKIILPVLPLFIAQIGGGGLAVGVISGVGESVASLLKMLAGYWSDRTGRRKAFVFWGYLVSSVAKFLLAFASVWPQVLGLRTAERFGKGVRSAPRDAILAASTHRARRGRGFGIHRAMDSGGAVLGTLVAFGLFWYLDFGFADIFLVAGVVGFFSLAPLFFVREPAATGEAAGKPKLGLAELNPALRKFLLASFLFALANFSYMFFVLRSESAFEGRFAAGLPILLYGLFNLVFTLFAVPAGILSDRIGRKKVLVAGYGLFGAICIGFVFATSPAAFAVLFTLYGVSYALVEANERALVADLAHEHSRGTALGTYHMVVSLAALPAGLIAGLLWDTTHPVFAFYYGAAAALSAALLLGIQVRNRD
jgi:MFS family permease